jgi:hypothetical protein
MRVVQKYELWYYSDMGILSSILSAIAITGITSAVYKRYQTSYPQYMPNIGNYVKVYVNG